MRGPLTIILERGLEQLPGLIFVTAGMGLLAAALLVPAWQSNRELTRRHATLQHQAERMDVQRQRYGDFHDALAAGDPVLLQRLAYSQLRVRPAEGEPWTADGLTWVSSSAANDHLATSPSIDAALAEPLSELVPVSARPAPPTRLVRLASGTSRIVLMIAGGFFVLGGLGYNGGRSGSAGIVRGAY